MYVDVHELAAEHITVIYEKLDNIERKMDLEFEGVRSELRRQNIDMAELKLGQRRTDAKLNEIDEKVSSLETKLDLILSKLK